MLLSLPILAVESEKARMLCGNALEEKRCFEVLVSVVRMRDMDGACAEQK